MTKTLVLHAGLPKTGTTTIQNAFLRSHEFLLHEHQFLYPSFDANHTNAICTLFLTDPLRHITNKMAARDAAFDLAAVHEKYRADLEGEFAKDGWTRALVSAEGISNLSAVEIERFRNWAMQRVDKVEVLVWVREPQAYVTSVVQQLLKGGQTLEEMMADPPLPNFKGKISNQIAVFGREAVRVESFEAATAHAQGIVGAFAHQIGLPDDAMARVVASATRDNESLSQEAAMMLDSLNRERPLFGETKIKRTGRETLHLQGVRGNKFRLPHEFRKTVYDTTRDDVAWLSQNFDVSLYTDPFDTTLDAPQPIRADTIRTTAALLSNLMNTVEALTLTLQARNLHSDGKINEAARKMERALSFDRQSAIVTRQANQMLKKMPE